MTKDQEASRWYAEQMGLLWDECHPVDYLSCVCSRGTKSCGVKHFTITDPACQMAILNEWIDSAIRYTDGSWSIKKGTGNNGHIGYGSTIKDALAALWEALRDER